jgi:hypothetical protein
MTPRRGQWSLSKLSATPVPVACTWSEVRYRIAVATSIS